MSRLTDSDINKLFQSCEPSLQDSADAAALKVAVGFMAVIPYPGDDAMVWSIRHLAAALPEFADRELPCPASK